MTELDDDTLIALIKQGDTHAEALLCSKYWVFARNLGKKFANLYSDLGLTADDFSAVAFSSIVLAMKKYRPGKTDKPFHGYWLIIAKNQCINFVHDNSFIDIEAMRPLSLDSTSHNNGLTLHETYGEYDNQMTFGITRKQLFDFIASDDNQMTRDEKLAAYYVFLEDFDYEDICKLLKWSKDKAYRVLRSAREKVSYFFKSGYFN